MHGTAYAEFTQSYLKSMGVPASILTEMDGKYVEATSTTTLASFSPLCNLSDMVSGLETEVTGFVKAGTGLAANTGSFTFSDYNARVTITAPPAADIEESNPLGI